MLVAVVAAQVLAALPLHLQLVAMVAQEQHRLLADRLSLTRAAAAAVQVAP
jgi:hypothetical protein